MRSLNMAVIVACMLIEAPFSRAEVASGRYSTQHCSTKGNGARQPLLIPIQQGPQLTSLTTDKGSYLPRYRRIAGEPTQTTKKTSVGSVHTVTYALENGGQAVITTTTLARSARGVRRLEVKNSKGQVVHWRREVLRKGKVARDLHSVSTYDVSFLDTVVEGNHRAYLPYEQITQRSQHGNHSYVREYALPIHGSVDDNQVLRNRFWPDTHSKINKPDVKIDSPALPGFTGAATRLPMDR